MQNSHNNKAMLALIVFGAPIVILARHGWSFGGFAMILFLVGYFLISALKTMRESLVWLDKYIVACFTVSVCGFLIIDFVGLSPGYTAVLVMLIGLISLKQLLMLSNYFKLK